MGGVVPVELIEIIEEASELLNSELLLDAPESKRCGRPMIHLPVQELEHLLSMNFSVPQMAIMFGVSRDTIFRRMRSAGLSVSFAKTLTTVPEIF
jgi:transcriptional regulator of acetoin/glycerol metabolism